MSLRTYTRRAPRGKIVSVWVDLPANKGMTTDPVPAARARRSHLCALVGAPREVRGRILHDFCTQAQEFNVTHTLCFG